MRRLKNAFTITAVFAAAIVLTLVAPFPVGWLYNALVRQGWIAERAFWVTDANGTVIGHGLPSWGATAINVGYMQTIEGATSGRTHASSIVLPSWATAELPPPSTAATSCALGWPMHSYSYRQYLNHNNLAAGQTLSGPFLIPLGFIVDVIFFALVVVAVRQCIHLAKRIRARLRARHQQCAACGYDARGTTSVCPECGTAVLASMRRAVASNG